MEHRGPASGSLRVLALPATNTEPTAEGSGPSWGQLLPPTSALPTRAQGQLGTHHHRALLLGLGRAEEAKGQGLESSAGLSSPPNLEVAA